MAIRGTSLAEREDIILPSDPAHPDQLKDATPKQIADAGEPSFFTIGNLTKDDKVEIGDLDGHMVQTERGMVMPISNTRRAYMTVERGCHGWKNVVDEHGNQIPFLQETGMVNNKPRIIVAEAALSRLRKDTVMELAKEISTRNGLRTNLEKKLEGLSLQQPAQPSKDGDATMKNAQPVIANSEDAE